MRRLVRLFALLALALSCLPTAPAAAVPFEVTSTADGTATGTLRWAIKEANARMGGDSIPIEATGTIGLEDPLPTITDSVAIIGPGAGSLTIERADSALFRILHFGPSVTGSLSGVTISGGVDVTGAGILNGSGPLSLTGVVLSGNEARALGNVANAGGGGVFSQGPLTLRGSYVHSNGATAISGGGEEAIASGAGIEALGPLTVERSTISENSAIAAGEGGEQVVASGGGVLVAGGPVTIEESTISGNGVLASEATKANVARGGGIQGNSASITGSTVTGNFASVDESGAEVEFAVGANLQTPLPLESIVRNSIVSNPQGDADSCSGGIASSGFNLDEDGSCEFGLATDLVGVIAGLSPVLAANGGPTPTHALFENSPALDRGNAFGASVDQRGLPRPSDLANVSNAEGGDGSDIGAYELQAPPPSPPVLVTPVAADTQAPNTRVVSGPPRNTFKRLAKFRFASTEPQSTFQCKLDKRSWRGCANPFKRQVKPGKHLFKVRAIDRFGNVDPTPARFGWRVKKVVG